MLSRVANSVYWTARYIERVENYARFMSVNINLSYELPEIIADHWSILMEATNDKPFFESLYNSGSAEKVIHFITFDPLNPNSIYTMLGYIRENVRTIREVLPKEFWEAINTFYLNFKNFAIQPNHDTTEMMKYYERLKMHCQHLTGMLDACLTRNEIYYFFNLGKYIERADKTSRFLDIGYFNYNTVEANHLNETQNLLIWSAVLKSVSALNMYRQQYKRLDQDTILKFLIKDAQFPRAINFAINRAKEALFEISGHRKEYNFISSAEKEMNELCSFLNTVQLKDIQYMSLHSFLYEFQKRNNAVGTEIHKVYFSII